HSAHSGAGRTTSGAPCTGRRLPRFHVATARPGSTAAAARSASASLDAPFHSGTTATFLTADDDDANIAAIALALGPVQPLGRLAQPVLQVAGLLEMGGQF